MNQISAFDRFETYLNPKQKLEETGIGKKADSKSNSSRKSKNSISIIKSMLKIIFSSKIKYFKYLAKTSKRASKIISKSKENNSKKNRRKLKIAEFETLEA